MKMRNTECQLLLIVVTGRSVFETILFQGFIIQYGKGNYKKIKYSFIISVIQSPLFFGLSHHHSRTYLFVCILASLLFAMVYYNRKENAFFLVFALL